MRIVVLDPGHGGSDSGACAGGLVEKTVNLETAISIKSTLEKNGVRVFLTRDSDNYVSLEDRVAFANRIYNSNSSAEVVFMSLHHNCGGGDRGEYIHSILRGNGQKLAECIGDEMLNTLGQQKKVYYRESEVTSGTDYYYVIKHTSMPAVIVEVAFLDNINDVQICNTYDKRVRNGQVIANGVLAYFGQAKSNIGNTNDMPAPITASAISLDCNISTLQNELNIQGFTDSDGKKLKVDNDLGSKTLSAVSKVRLRIGSEGNITRWMQCKLLSLGYDLGKYGADGKFGDDTYDAVVKFQRNNGLDDDGVVGPITWNCLLNK